MSKKTMKQYLAEEGLTDYRLAYQIELKIVGEENLSGVFNGKGFNSFSKDTEPFEVEFKTKKEAVAEARKQAKILRNSIDFNLWSFLPDYYISVLLTEADEEQLKTGDCYIYERERIKIKDRRIK